MNFGPFNRLASSRRHKLYAAHFGQGRDSRDSRSYIDTERPAGHERPHERQYTWIDFIPAPSETRPWANAVIASPSDLGTSVKVPIRLGQWSGRLWTLPSSCANTRNSALTAFNFTTTT